MKISYKWLNELIKIDKKPEQLANDIISLGHEVENIEIKNNDYIFDLSLTANRGDCLSVLGIARELSALYNKKINFNIPHNKIENIKEKINIFFENKDICPRYTARIIKNIQIKKSSSWLIKKLKSYGFRSLNNIVDITNYIMILTGQPMHAYDYDKIKSHLFKVKLAKEGDYIITLDGIERKLDKDTIIIEDKEKIFDLAGIMGGFNSEIDKKTKTIVLESAIFDSKLIRLTSKKLKLQTDASYRYERTVDISQTKNFLDLATNLINKNCPNSINGKIYDIINQKIQKKQILIKYNKINKLLGINLDKNTINQYLKRLGFDIYNNNAIIPSHRINDITIWQDLAEEVARLYGYNKFSKIKLKKSSKKNNYNYWEKESIKDFLFTNGFTEIISYSFADMKLIKMLNFDLKRCIEIDNPLSPETKYLRPSLIPSILTAVAKNPWAPEINIFEYGKIFNPIEKYQLILATSSKKAKFITNFLDKYKITSRVIEVPQKILNYLKIRKKIYYAIINTENLQIKNIKINTDLPKNNYKKISNFPPTIRDFAFILNKNIKIENIINDVCKLSNDILIVEQFDEFYSPKIGKNNKSIALHIWIQNQNSKIIDKISDKIINLISKKYKGELRS